MQKDGEWTLVGYESEEGDCSQGSPGSSRNRPAASSSTKAEPAADARSTPTETAAPAAATSANEFWLDALNQAKELYEVTDPDAAPQEIQAAAEKMAREATFAEALRKPESELRNGAPDWLEARAAALSMKAQGAALQEDAPVRQVEPVRRQRPRQPANPGPTSAPLDNVPKEPPEKGPKTRYEKAAARWQALMETAIRRRKWSETRRAQGYATKGMPRQLDTRAPRGFGAHSGRWGWREVSSSW